MSKVIFVIQPHSFIDVITNSSTELFVCEKGKTLRQIQDICNEQLPGMTGYRVRYPTVDDLIVIRFKKELKTVEKSHGWESKEIFGTPVYEDSYGIGENTVIIEGTGDNSIDSDYFDEIENLFNASRYHLG